MKQMTMTDVIDSFLTARNEAESFLFPDEIREILRHCDDRTRIGIYDMDEFPDITEVYHYEVIRPDNRRARYLTRYGIQISEEDLAMRIYDFREDGYGVFINGHDILEVF
ncbi:MAG: hypothetical protein J6Y26_04725 [Lachnospiraceae bacterium]|nr:hypothetical protein [Lachnospiraceae bacterium]